MLTVNFKGELGNNLFQLATLLAIVKDHHPSISNHNFKSTAKDDAYFLRRARDCYISVTDRPIEIESMFEYDFNWTADNLPRCRVGCLDNDTNAIGMNWSYQSDYVSSVLSRPEPIIELDGYFQSSKYFESIEDDLLNKCFVFKKEIRDRMDTKYGDLSSKIALHVRRGGDREALKHKFGGVTMEYYQRALNLVLALSETDVEEVLVFSDDPDWCDAMFEASAGYQIIRGNKNYEDMYLMTQCAHVILANSTFSWWGAYLNQNPNKIVVYPANEWFGPGLRHLYIEDMFPEEWIGV